MRLKDYTGQEGKRVWLSEREMQHLLDNVDADHPEAHAAFLLAGRCGLRRDEVIQVTPSDIVRTDHGQTVRVWNGKGDQYREVPAPATLTDLLLGMSKDPDEPVVDCAGSTVWDYVNRASRRCRAESGDEGWQYVGPHDLRRSWAILTLERGVIPSLVMEWGGWNDWETFRDHYLSEFSPEAVRRERRKLSWLGEYQGEQRSGGSDEGYSQVSYSGDGSFGGQPSG